MVESYSIVTGRRQKIWNSEGVIDFYWLYRDRTLLTYGDTAARCLDQLFEHLT